MELICPACGAIHHDVDEFCKRCELPLAWLAHTGPFLVALRKAAHQATNPKAPFPEIEAARQDTIPLDVNAPVILGRRLSSQAHVHEVPDARVELEHCVIVRQPRTSHFWLADQGTRFGTWVNRRRITVVRLTGDDVLQIGGYAWVFNESDHLLAPLPRLHGADLQLSDVTVEVSTRQGTRPLLSGLSLNVPAGQFVAIAGESGTGKSTLMKAILGALGPALRGTITAAGRDQRLDREDYRALLGYVPQHEIVHPDLQAWQAIDLAARLRGRFAARERIAQLLHRLDLPRERWDATPRRLSGGELQRVRLASEMVSGPRLLLLDEPAGGLDQGRELRLMNLLRGLSIQGCTVLVITHGLRHLEYFDRVLILQRGGVLSFDGAPADLRQYIPSGDYADLDLSDPPTHHTGIPPTPQAPTVHTPTRRPLARLREGVRQFNVLFQREVQSLTNAWPRRLLAPLAFMPLFFALALHIAVPADNRPLLGFFAILASIWMGSSLSLMAIVNERGIFDHERLLFLHVSPFVVAKCAILGILSALQCVLLVLFLSLMRSFGRGEMLLDPPWVAVHLSLVGWAAMGVGLLVSAMSGENRALANFILPLFMIMQMVFSVQVAGKGELSLRKAYGEFHVHRCEGPHHCPRRAEHWIVAYKAWLCQRCFVAYRQCEKDGLTFSEVISCMRQQVRAESPSEPSVVEYNAARPAWLAALVSYTTISRYGDIALRSFAYELVPDDAMTSEQHNPYLRHNYAAWRWNATAMLAAMIVFFPTLVWLVLLR